MHSKNLVMSNMALAAAKSCALARAPANVSVRAAAVCVLFAAAVARAGTDRSCAVVLSRTRLEKAGVRSGVASVPFVPRLTRFWIGIVFTC